MYGLLDRCSRNNLPRSRSNLRRKTPNLRRAVLRSTNRRKSLTSTRAGKRSHDCRIGVLQHQSQNRRHSRKSAAKSAFIFYVFCVCACVSLCVFLWWFFGSYRLTRYHNVNIGLISMHRLPEDKTTTAAKNPSRKVRLSFIFWRKVVVYSPRGGQTCGATSSNPSLDKTSMLFPPRVGEMVTKKLCGRIKPLAGCIKVLLV